MLGNFTLTCRVVVSVGELASAPGSFLVINDLRGVLIGEGFELLGRLRHGFLATGGRRGVVILKRALELVGKLFWTENSTRVCSVFLRFASFDALPLRVSQDHRGLGCDAVEVTTVLHTF